MGNEYTRKGSKILSQIHGEKCWPMVDKMSPCEEACPIHMDVPSYVIALSQGRFREAIDVVRETNPFPSICGRVCHHPCEMACTRALIDKPVAIEWLKRFVGEYEKTNGGRKKRVRRKRGEKVAVIGSGPAGLTAAHDLALKGFRVKVYEALPNPGGMLIGGIPDFILPQHIVKSEIEYIKNLGVRIQTNMRVGKDITLDDIRSHGFNAILLATGAWKSATLSIPGVTLKGVIQALPFLHDVKLGKKPKLHGKVVVIGGGNVAVNAARTALRLGAENVSLVCLESLESMPAFEWEIELAEQEGAEIFPALAPQQLLAKTRGKVGRIELKKVKSTSLDSDGKISWTLLEGPDTDVSMDADWVIIAVGQIPDDTFIEAMKREGGGSFKIDSETMATHIPGLFAAGDVVKRQGTVVEAIAAGHTAAISMERYLKGKHLSTRRRKKTKPSIVIEEEMIPSFLVQKDRWDMPALSSKDAVRSFGETKLGYTEWQVIEEAKRCLNCRMCGNCIFERGQLCFETSARLL